ncbi:MAG TPA: hypothetical protein VGR47_03915 [Terracidiphilus sp.]|nr:hypothetical protein [Terracidiphilus sp.]
MPTETYEDKKQRHEQHMSERDKLIDAARESLRTFDKAVLAFGSAVFGASVAFLKDVAPKPLAFTVHWLWTSWLCFTAGLLAIVLSFLFGYQTCIARIESGAAKLENPNFSERRDWWGILTHWSNWSCVAFLFAGVVTWVIFAVENVARQ